ncbi:MAG TPA: O-antigen ligase family protein [Bryobacteraceae bacterium]|jgi:O-antigen ligase|nr:O-antigen ligase family protein [Bryobacteraceae bacterium]
MSRFNISRTAVETALETLPVRAIPARRSETSASLILEPSVSEATLVQRAGFVLMCIFAVSGYVNEFALRYFHVKAYISTVSWVVLPLLLVLSGNLLRGLRDMTGRLWLFFLLWVTLAVPFSVWKGGSAALLLGYVSRGWIQLYYYSAFLIAFRYCRRFMFFLIASNVMLLLDCFLFGATASGRFAIPDSIFFANANDLALQLLIAVTQFLYLLYQRQVWKHLLGATGILLALMYMLKTGSRGALLAALTLALVSILFGRNRIRLAIAGVPIALALLLLVPSSFFHRFTVIAFQPQSMAVRDSSDASAVASQIQRMALLRLSVTYAITHPLLGVGPGQFAVAASGDAAKEGKVPNWLGTHNSYTEIASECGLPAFFLYVAVIVVTLRSNFWIFRRTAHLAEYRDLSALAFCFFSATLVYAICTFFFHIAYSSYLPSIAGMSVALRLATSPRLWNSRPGIETHSRPPADQAAGGWVASKSP